MTGPTRTLLLLVAAASCGSPQAPVAPEPAPAVRAPAPPPPPPTPPAGAVQIGVPYPGRTVALAVAPGGDTLAASGDRVTLWDLRTGAQRIALDVGGRPAWNRDGTRLLVATQEALTVFDPASGETVLRVEEPTPLASALSPDGHLLATTSHSGRIRLRDAANGDLVREIDRRWTEGHEPRIHALAFSPDGALLAAGGSLGEIQVYEVATGALRHTLGGAPEQVNDVAFSPDGRRVLAAMHPGSVRVYDLERPEAPPSVLPVGATTYALDVGTATFAAGDLEGNVRVWSLADEAPLATLAVGAPVNDLALVQGDARLIVATGSARWHLWDLSAGEEVPQAPEPEGHHGPVTAATWSMDGRWLITASGPSDRLCSWEVASGALRGCVAFEDVAGRAPNAPVVLGDSALRWAGRSWTVDDGGRLRDGGAPPAGVPSPDGRLEAWVDGDVLRVRAAGTGEEQAALALPPELIAGEDGRGWNAPWVNGDAGWTRDGRFLLSWGRDVRAWDVTKGFEPWPLSEPKGTPPVRLDLWPHGYVTWATSGGAVVLWKPGRVQAELWPLAEGERERTALAANGLLVAVGSDRSAEVHLHDPCQTTPFGTVTLEAPPEALALSPDGSLLAVGRADGTLRLWPVTFDPWAAPPVRAQPPGDVPALEPGVALWSFFGTYAKAPSTPLLVRLKERRSSFACYGEPPAPATVSDALEEGALEAGRAAGIAEPTVTAWRFDDAHRLLVVSEPEASPRKASAVYLAGEALQPVIERPDYEYTGPTRVTVDLVAQTPLGSAALLDFEGYARAWLTLVGDRPYLLFVSIEGEQAGERWGETWEEPDE